MRAIFCRVPCDSSVVELLDPFCWVGEPVAAGDSERGEVAILDIAIQRLKEGVDIPDKMGLQELDCFVEVIQLLLVTFFFGGQFLLEVVGACFRGDDESVDDGLVGVGFEGMSGDGTAD